jgi:hypothetical protein
VGNPPAEALRSLVGAGRLSVRSAPFDFVGTCGWPTSALLREVVADVYVNVLVGELLVVQRNHLELRFGFGGRLGMRAATLLHAGRSYSDYINRVGSGGGVLHELDRLLLLPSLLVDGGLGLPDLLVELHP